ncbi:MAG: hypothetical protein ACTHZ9_12345, partial [Leucobacter sp.]
FAELRDFYEDTAVYTNPTASEIAVAAEQLLARRSALQSKTLDLRKRRIAEQAHAVEQLKKLVESSAHNRSTG